MIFPNFMIIAFKNEFGLMIFFRSPQQKVTHYFSVWVTPAVKTCLKIMDFHILHMMQSCVNSTFYTALPSQISTCFTGISLIEVFQVNGVNPK